MFLQYSQEEKQDSAKLMGEHLKRLRAIAGFTQEDLGVRSGISKERISRIENKAFVMTWSQFTSFLLVFSMYIPTKEYLFASKILTPRLLQWLQMKEENVPPDVVVPVNDLLIQDFITDFRIAGSLSTNLDGRRTNSKKKQGSKEK